MVAALGLAPFVCGPLPAHAATAKPLGDAARAKKAMRIAKHQLGDPYKYGAEGPDKFDCSGLVYFATHRAGFKNVPRTSADQAAFMRHIKRSNMRPGDFVFFTSKGDVYHVGVYVGRSDGNRMIVHAPSPGEKVKRDPLWTDKWFPGTLRGA
jgi:cell wall-associated NlpC family hydrolase